MKQLLLCSLFITTNLFCMTITDFFPKTQDDMYSAMELAELEEPSPQKPATMALCEIFTQKKPSQKPEHRENNYRIATQLKDSLKNRSEELLLFCKQYKPFYKKCIAHLLPLEICEQIDCISAQLRNKEIRETFVKAINHDSTIKPTKLRISNNGHYLAHFNHYGIELMNIEQNKFIATFSAESKKKPVYFSPNSEYCIIKGGSSLGIQQTAYLYNFLQNENKKHIITPKEHCHCSGIIISHDSKYVLYKDEISSYTPWILDAQGTPQKVTLINNLFLTGSQAVIFHPNKHIIHSRHHDELRLYNLETGLDKIVFFAGNKNIYIEKLTLSPDNKKIIGTYTTGDFLNDKGYVLFNIENLDNVTSVLIPYQSIGDNTKRSKLPPLCIPPKNMIAHITNRGRTLQLLDDTNMQCITFHDTNEKVHITALAVDNSGNYLASGYSDGTIMIWNLFSSNPKKYAKTFMKSIGEITSLTFSDNQLLLSQSATHIIQKKSGHKNLITYGAAELWDVYGNKIMHVGNNIIKSIMSKNGKTIVTINAALDLELIVEDKFLTTYHQTDENVARYSQKEMTLAQISMLIAEQNKK